MNREYLIKCLEADNIPVTERAIHILLAYGAIPSQWDSEMESELPADLQDWDALSQSLDLDTVPSALPSRL